MPIANQQNDTHSLCFVAVNSVGLNSKPFCMQLAVGYHPPAPFPESTNHQLVYPSNNTLRGGGTGPADPASARPKIQIILKL